MTPTVTALGRAAPGRVRVEVDGRPWRVVSDDVVLRCGLAAGVPLERPRLRRLARELRRVKALEAAARSLAHADLSAAQLDRRLARAGARPRDRAEALRSLAAAGAVDDARVARRRAERLAARGWGDAAIRARLAGEGIAEDVVREALAVLEPEDVRAEALVEGRAGEHKAVRLLARRGFDDEVVARFAARLDAEG